MLGFGLLVIALFSVSVILVYSVYRYAQVRLLDTPNARSSHQRITPRGGGLGSVLAFFSLSSYWVLHQMLTLREFGLICAALGVAVIGFVDDHRHVAARWRLSVHLLAALIAMLCLGLPKINCGFLTQTAYYEWLIYLVGILWLTWSLNLFNFMDGIDGIAAMEAIFVASALAGFMGSIDARLAQIALALAVVSAGFLVWNWPPAKIFMGDVGSGFIGFMLGALIILFSYKQAIFAVLGLILFAVFIVDASFTLSQRLIQGHKCYQAHCSHAYQKLAKRYPNSTLGHQRVVLGVLSLNVAYLLPLAVLAFNLPHYGYWCLLAAYLPLLLLAYYLRAGR